MENAATSNITKGLTISLILVALDIIAGFAGFRNLDWYKWLIAAVIVLSIVISCLLYGKQNGYNVSFGNLFAHGFKTTAVVICIIVLYTFISTRFIFPDTEEIVLAQARKQMEEQGKRSKEEVEQGINTAKQFFITFMVAGAIFRTGFSGAIAAVLGATLTKKNTGTSIDKKN